MVLVVLMVLGGVALGYLRGGRLRNLGATPLRWPALAGIALTGQIALTAPASPGGLLRTLTLVGISAALVGFAWKNRTLPGMGLMLLGFMLNATVIAVNNGMPVSPAALAAIGENQAPIHSSRHRLLKPGDRLGLLADVLPIPALGSIYSIGDLTVAAGMGTLMTNLMRPGVGGAATSKSLPSARQG
ncbi:MAG: DUF5317 family protein [Egibacteraceae bacterium]